MVRTAQCILWAGVAWLVAGCAASADEDSASAQSRKSGPPAVSPPDRYAAPAEPQAVPADGPSAQGSLRDPSKRLYIFEVTPNAAALDTGLELARQHHYANAAREGKVLLAGRAGFRYVVVCQFGSEEEARAFARSDPGLARRYVLVSDVEEWSLVHDTYGPRRTITVPGPGKPPRDGG